MVLGDRDTLKIRFQQGRHLSEQDFSTLIDSMLNKRSDHFHGTWQEGRTYCKGDVVLYCTKKMEDGKEVIQSGNLWMMKAERCICSNQPPLQDSSNWMPFPNDGDWVTQPDEKVMWAKVYDRVGIGIGSDSGDRPQARLDVRKIDASTKVKGQGRWLLFPAQATHTQATFLHYAGGIQPTNIVAQARTAELPLFSPLNQYQPQQFSYLVTSLSLKTTTWCSDASHGFTFRRGKPLQQESDALQLDPTAGTVMMVLQPRSIPAHPSRELASLGLNVAHPGALLDITDPHRGHLLFLPDASSAPTLCLLRPKPEGEGKQAYATVRLGSHKTSLFSNGSEGFAFYQGNSHPGNPTPIGDVLLQLRQNSTLHRPQVGIGTHAPAARLDINCQADRAQVQILPEQIDGSALPAIALLQHRQEAEPRYLTTGISNYWAGWISNAEQGFIFRQAVGIPEDCDTPDPGLLQPGQTQMVIRESGYVGIGTEDPLARLEITSHFGIGTVLFDLDQQSYPAIGIRNQFPEQNFTLGTGTNHAVLFTDTPEGFQFKASSTEADALNSNPLDILAGRVLVNISPQGNGRVGIGCAPRDYEIDVQGIIQTRQIYQDTNVDQVHHVKPLASVLSRLHHLHPITFVWNGDTETEWDSSAPAPPTISAPEVPAPDRPESVTPGVELASSEETLSVASSQPAVSKTPSSSHHDQQFGLLAHEVEAIFPQVVKTANDGSQSVAYTSLVPVLIQAIKDLDRQHQLDQRRMETLVNQLANRTAWLGFALVISWAIALLNYLF